MTMPKLIEDNTNIVILGTWNLGILIPEWFKEQFPSVVKENEIPIEVALGAGSFRFIINGIQINPSPNRLILSPKKPDKEHYLLTSTIAVGVIDKLPHTPVFAVGFNMSYLLENQGIKVYNDSDLKKQKDFYKDTLKLGDLGICQMKHSLAFENYMLNITYSQSTNKKTIDFNYHYPIKNKGRIKDFLSEFPDKMTDSEQILTKVVE
jgi:hypothetical protein